MLTSELLKMSASAWPPILNVFIMSVMATYLTGVWELSIVQAAQILNIYAGAVAILPLLMQILMRLFEVETLATYSMVLLSRFAYTAGFALLTLSAPPVLSSVVGTCTEEEAECVGQLQKNLFYIGLTLIGVADWVHEQSAGRFLMTNLMKLVSSWRIQASEPDSEQLLQPQLESSGANYRETSLCCFLCDQPRWSYLILTILGFMLPPLAGIIAIGYINAWWIKLMIPALFAVASLAAILCITLDHGQPPPPSNQLFRFYYPTEEGISPLWVVPICINFFLLGVVFSIGNTFFIEQATDLYLYLWIFKIAITTLPLLQKAVKVIWFLPMYLCSQEPFLGTFVSMIFATLCCITAAKVETRRLSVVTAEGVIDQPDVIISMSICWLIPQFILLGFAEGLSVPSICKFFQELPGLPEDFSENVAQSVNGVGILCGVLSVYIVGEIQPTWFQSTLNASRLDNYFWVLAALSAVNLVLCPLGILFFVIGLPRSDREHLKMRYQMLIYNFMRW